MSEALPAPTGVWRDADSFKKDYKTWDDLNEIEGHRRDILQRANLPFLKILSFWDGTCLQALSYDWLLWVTMSIYIIIRVQAHMEAHLAAFVADLGGTDINVIGGFLSFFLVFFVNQTNTRFWDMYQCSKKGCGKILDITSMINSSFPRANAYRLVRYLNAAHVSAYVGLSETYNKVTFFDPVNKKYALLTDSEMRRLNEIGLDQHSDSFMEIIEWCFREIRIAKEKGYVDSRESGALTEKLMGFRDAMGALYDYADQPVHFFYIHFLCLLSALYLPLFAVDSAYSAGSGEDMHFGLDVVNGLIVLLQGMFVIGLRLLGAKLIDPYGTDDEDLSVLNYVESAWKTSQRLLETRFPTEVSEPEEEDLLLRKESIGYPWEPQKSTGLRAV